MLFQSHLLTSSTRSISDHLPVYVELDLKLPKPPPPCYISTRSYKHHNPDLLTADLATKSDKFLSLSLKLATFNDTFLSTLDAHAPIKSIRIRSRPCPYVTREIKDQMTFRDQLFRRYRQSWYSDAWKAYKEARRCVKQLLKNAECDHICTEVQSHKDNPGSLRKIISTCIPSKEKETPVYSRNTELVANDFNQFFSFVGRNFAQTTAQLTIDNNINISDTCLISPPTTRNSSEELFNFTPVTCTQVERIVSSMPSNKSPGPDKVSMHIIKDCLPVIPGPLTDIINCSFATSTFPNSWKASEVIPQGAIQSPLLFCIYISDLPLAPQACNLESYVDDSKIFLSFPVKDAESAERALKDLRRVAAWCSKNQPLINPEKTSSLWSGHNNYCADFLTKSRSLSWGKRSHLSPVPRISE